MCRISAASYALNVSIGEKRTALLSISPTATYGLRAWGHTTVYDTSADGGTSISPLAM